MLGVPVITHSIFLGDNCSVQVSGSQSSSQLQKKHLAVAFHKIREAVAAGITLFYWIGTLFNVADVLTKPLNGEKHSLLISYILFGKGKSFMKGSVSVEDSLE